MNLIRGNHVFRVAGYNMVLDDDGAEVFLKNALGATIPVTVDSVTSKQLFTAHVAGNIEPGDYKFVVKSRAGDPDGPLQTAFRRVKYMRVEDPGPDLTGVHAPGIESPMIRVESSVWFDGTGLDGWTEGRDSIWCKNNRAEEAEFVRLDGDGSGAAVEFDGGMLKADEGAWSVLTDLGIVEGSEVRFKVTINGQSAEIVGTVAEA
jgi:hypothetical protein